MSGNTKAGGLPTGDGDLGGRPTHDDIDGGGLSDGDEEMQSADDSTQGLDAAAFVPDSSEEDESGSEWEEGEGGSDAEWEDDPPDSDAEPEASDDENEEEDEDLFAATGEPPASSASYDDGAAQSGPSATLPALGGLTPLRDLLEELERIRAAPSPDLDRFWAVAAAIGFPGDTDDQQLFHTINSPGIRALAIGGGRTLHDGDAAQPTGFRARMAAAGLVELPPSSEEVVYIRLLLLKTLQSVILHNANVSRKLPNVYANIANDKKKDLEARIEAGPCQSECDEAYVGSTRKTAASRANADLLKGRQLKAEGKAASLIKEMSTVVEPVVLPILSFAGQTRSFGMGCERTIAAAFGVPTLVNMVLPIVAYKHTFADEAGPRLSGWIAPPADGSHPTPNPLASPPPGHLLFFGDLSLGHVKKWLGDVPVLAVCRKDQAKSGKEALVEELARETDALHAAVRERKDLKAVVLFGGLAAKSLMLLARRLDSNVHIVLLDGTTVTVEPAREGGWSCLNQQLRIGALAWIDALRPLAFVVAPGAVTFRRSCAASTSMGREAASPLQALQDGRGAIIIWALRFVAGASPFDADMLAYRSVASASDPTTHGQLSFGTWRLTTVIPRPNGKAAVVFPIDSPDWPVRCVWVRRRHAWLEPHAGKRIWVRLSRLEDSLFPTVTLEAKVNQQDEPEILLQRSLRWMMSMADPGLLNIYFSSGANPFSESELSIGQPAFLSSYLLPPRNAPARSSRVILGYAMRTRKRYVSVCFYTSQEEYIVINLRKYRCEQRGLAIIPNGTRLAVLGLHKGNIVIFLLTCPPPDGSDAALNQFGTFSVSRRHSCLNSVVPLALLSPLELLVTPLVHQVAEREGLVLKSMWLDEDACRVLYGLLNARLANLGQQRLSNFIDLEPGESDSTLEDAEAMGRFATSWARKDAEEKVGRSLPPTTFLIRDALRYGQSLLDFVEGPAS